MIAEDFVRFAHFGPSQRFLRGLTTTCLRSARCKGPPDHLLTAHDLPLPVSRPLKNYTKDIIL